MMLLSNICKPIYLTWNVYFIHVHLFYLCMFIWIFRWFNNYSESEFPRAGTRAAYSVTLNEGPLSDTFIHSMEPSLRQLGLPTSLQRGVIQVLKEHTICKEGTILTPEQSRLLVINFCTIFLTLSKIIMNNFFFRNFLDIKWQNSKLF